MSKTLQAKCIGVFFAWVLACAAHAEVFTTLDRTVVQINESFTLVLTADEGEQGEPDLTPLAEHFDVLGRSQNSSISIINGRRETSRRWTIVLLPKTAGAFEVPSLSVGGVASKPLSITIKPAVSAPPGEADVFFEVTLDTPTSWVQAEVIYTIKLYLGVAVRQTSLDEPRIEGGEVIVQKLAEDRRYEAQVGERLYTVIERNFSLFPQASGDYEIASARFTASLWERGRISTPRVFQSQPLSLSVKPTVAPPPELAGSAWLPAKGLTLDTQIRPDDGILDTGEPANVRVRLSATGLMGSQLPEFSLDAATGLRVYPDQPDVTERALQTGMQSRREQSFAVIAGAGGVFDLPTMQVPWFNTTIGEWQVASAALPTIRAAGVITSTPSVVADAAPQEVDAADTAAPPSGGVASEVVRDQLFRLKAINFALLALWLATLAWVWRGTRARDIRRRSHRQEQEQQAPYRTTRRALKQLQQACSRNDPGAAHAAVLQWAAAFWPDQPVRTLGDIARRIDPEDAAPILALDRYRYRDASSDWDGSALSKAVLRLHRPGVQTRTASHNALPPLFPSNG